MLAVPLLGGSLMRLVLGVMADRIGARRTGVIGLLLTLVPLLVGWLGADSYAKLLLVGLMLGVAGASFAAALPLASRWYPPQYQGMALGIAGAGNSGTVLATLFGPMLAAMLGWRLVFALALIPVLLTLLVFVFFAQDSPSQPPPKKLKDYAAVLTVPDTWRFCLFYCVTFGGFVGLAVFLNSFFTVQYGLSAVEAGYFASACVISGSFLRPVGGYLADRFGGVRILAALYLGVAALMLGVSTLPPLWLAAIFLFLGMGTLGMGNGSVFQLVPQRFPKEIGVLTGIVGAAGGIGGFLLPNLLGSLKQFTGTFSYAFVIFALIALVGAAVLVQVSRTWQGAFLDKGGLAMAALTK